MEFVSSIPEELIRVIFASEIAEKEKYSLISIYEK